MSKKKKISQTRNVYLYGLSEALIKTNPQKATYIIGAHKEVRWLRK